MGRGRPKKLSDLYAKRFDIEELFRDTKNEHLGWSLARTQISRADRLDRLILIAALAYLLLVALGLWCREKHPPRLWASNDRRQELSTFAICGVCTCHSHRCLTCCSAPWPRRRESGDESGTGVD